MAHDKIGRELFAPLITVSVTKAITTGGAYGANDVVSNSTSVGTAWTFADVVKEEGGAAYITKAEIISESEGVTPRFTLFLFDTTPTAALNDNTPNTNPDSADLANYIGKIDFPALESLGTTDSVAEANPGDGRGVPKAFKCTSASRAIYGVAVTRDIFTQTAGDDLTIRLTIEAL